MAFGGEHPPGSNAVEQRPASVCPLDFPQTSDQYPPVCIQAVPRGIDSLNLYPLAVPQFNILYHPVFWAFLPTDVPTVQHTVLMRQCQYIMSGPCLHG